MVSNRVNPPEHGAYLYWDEEWRKDLVVADWSTPEPWVVSVVRARQGREFRRVLDVGCGMGRHAMIFAQAGLECHGIDLSDAAVSSTRKQAKRAGLDIELCVGDFQSLPYEDGFFDYVLAWNVIYHGGEDKATTAIGEVARVLRRGGIFQTTMLSKRNAEYGKGTEVSPNSWVQPDGPEDKAYPHLYSDEHDLLRLYRKFRLLTAFDDQHRVPGSYHWHLVFERDAE